MQFCIFFSVRRTLLLDGRAQGQVASIADRLTDSRLIGRFLGQNAHLLCGQIGGGPGAGHRIEGVFNTALAVLAGHAVHTQHQPMGVVAAVAVGHPYFFGGSLS